MKRLLVSLVLVSLLAMPALADPVLTTTDVVTGSLGSVGSPRGATIYSNTTTPVAGYSGQGLALWVMDDLTPDYTLAGGNTVLDTVTFSVYYSSAAPVGSTMDAFSMDIGFWNDDLVNGPGGGGSTFIGSFPFFHDFGVGLGLTPGQYALLTYSGVGVGIDLLGAPNVFAGTKYNMVIGTGGMTNAFGQLVADPPTVGTATSVGWWEDVDPPAGAGANYWFGPPPAPPGNFAWDLTVIPEPTTLGLLVIGGLVALRRRR